MSQSPSDALAYGLACYQADAAGKTVLVGWRAQSPLFALAAGLVADTDREQYALLARYLLRRDKADGYWLLLSADLAKQEHLVAEQVLANQRQVTAAPLQRNSRRRCISLGDRVALGAEAILGDLLDGGEPLPAVMRRELDRLVSSLAVPMPPSPGP